MFIEVSQLVIGDRLNETHGIVWIVSNIAKQSKSVTLELTPDPETTGFLMVQPQPCLKRFKNGTKLQTTRTN